MTSHCLVTLSMFCPLKEKHQKTPYYKSRPIATSKLRQDTRCLKSRSPQDMSDVLSNLMPAIPEVPVFTPVKLPLQIASCQGACLQMLSFWICSALFLCLRLSPIHKLGIPISEERQNLAGMKGVCLTQTSFPKRRPAAGQKGARVLQPRGKTAQERVTHLPAPKALVVEPTTTAVVGNTTSHSLS